MVSLQCFELKWALIIRSLIGSQSIKVLTFSWAITRATPSVWVFSCPEYRMVEPLLIVWRPDPVQRHSLTPRMSTWYLFNSPCTFYLYVPYMVHTFHAPIQSLALGLSRLSIASITSSQGFLLVIVILPIAWLRSTLGAGYVWGLVIVVSVSECFFSGWGC